MTSYVRASFVTVADGKRPGIRRNSAETPSMKDTEKAGTSRADSAISLDRRVSVAPMMDYTDNLAFG